MMKIRAQSTLSEKNIGIGEEAGERRIEVDQTGKIKTGKEGAQPSCFARESIRTKEPDRRY